MAVLFRKFAKGLVTAIFAVIFRVEAVTAENMPVSGPALLCCNHKGILDMLFISTRINRWVYYMAKEELFRLPVLGTVIRWLGAFPVRRGRGDLRAVKTALKILRENHVVGIFPEGTRTKGNAGNRLKAKPGTAMLAIKAGVPVVPVAIEGSYRLFGKVRVIIGKPFALDIDRNKKYTVMEMAEISRSIMDRVYALMEG